MPGRTPYEAVESFLTPVQQAVSCVARDVIAIRGGHYPAADPHPLNLGDAEPVRLSGSTRIAISATLYYRIVESPFRGPWDVIVVAYYYALYDADSREILAYHWHPEGRSPVTTPHLHLGAGAQIQRTELTIAHLPTGRVALQDVLKLTITDFGVRPLRPDWLDVLDATRADVGG